MKLNQELINTLQAIHDGKPWQWREPSKSAWIDCIKGIWSPIGRLYNGCEIRIKPEPKPEPDPYAEAKDAWRDGELQYRQLFSDPMSNESWRDWGLKREPAWAKPPDCFRRKPKHIRVPLGPEDIPPGSVFRHPQWGAESYRSPQDVSQYGIGWSAYAAGDRHQFQELMDEGWLINRSTPMTGKWDAAAWEPCWKEVQP